MAETHIFKSEYVIVVPVKVEPLLSGVIKEMLEDVIYLYPEKETEVTVRIGFRDGGCITCSYPEYDDGWTVTAMPGGALYDSEGNEYYYLFWEGLGNAEFRSDGGYCVSGNDTAAFLREKLMQIGLSAQETNEFIIYWMPLVKDNPYNLITFIRMTTILLYRCMPIPCRTQS